MFLSITRTPFGYFNLKLAGFTVPGVSLGVVIVTDFVFGNFAKMIFWYTLGKSRASFPSGVPAG